jgi:hypothetical protein
MAMSFQNSGISGLNWRKPARSINAGNCTEVASTAGTIVVRDSKDPNSLVLRYPANSWHSFLGAARAGDFDTIG